MLITGGPNNLDLGVSDEDEDFFYDFDGGEIDASSFTGNLQVGVADGNQTVGAGTGDDVIADGDDGGQIYEVFVDNDLIDLSAGGADIVNFWDIFDIAAEAPDSGAWHHIVGFDVTDDIIASVNDEDGDDFVSTGGGDVIEGGLDFLVFNAQLSGFFEGEVQPSELIKFNFEVETDNDDFVWNGGGGAGLSHLTEQLEHERVVPSGALELGR